MAEPLGVASSVIAVVDLSAKVFSLCLQYSREVKNAKDDVERLRKEVTAFQDTTEKLKALLEGTRGRELKTSQQLISAIEDGHSALGKLEQRLRPSTGRKTISRFGMRALKWPFESKDFEGTIEKLERCRGNISLALNIDQIDAIWEMAAKLMQIRSSAILQNVDERTSLNQLPIAHGASFDSKAEEHNSTCLPDTRQELLDNIDNWIGDPNSKTVYWLNGMAGTGKSTIARTVARSRAKRGDLGASFFFKRGEIDRGNMNRLMSTLAYQLASSIPRVAFFIKKTLDANPTIVGKSLKEQFEKLIQEPLSEAAATATAPSSVVMVIDALDECDQEADIRLLINIFAQAKIVRPDLRAFVTSRPELPIRLGFSKVQGSYQDLVLHKIPAEIVEHDIVVFLNDEFKKIRCDFNMTVGDERKLPSDWPGHPTIQSLAQMAIPLFIFAATVCRFVGDSRRRNPRTRLRTVLNHENRNQLSQLEQTYTPILRSQITELPKEEREEVIKDFKVIVGSIVTLASPLSKQEDSRVATFVADAVRFLQANISVVTEAPLQIYSCLAFTPSKSVVRKTFEKAIPRWISNLPRVQESWDACLLTLEGHGDFVNSVVFSHDSKKVASASDDHMIGIWNAETGECERVLEGHSSRVNSVVFSHDSKKVASASDDHMIVIWNIEIGECERMLEGHSDRVNSVVFSHDSRKVASASDDKTIRIWDAETGECERVLEGHSDYVKLVVFSHDSKKVASASDDKTIRIWDAETGECERVLEGHSSFVSSVVFSHDSKKVASGSWDEMIRVWNAETGECERVLEGHSSYVRSVVFSHNSKKVASASDDKTIRIWDAETGEYEQALEGHSDWVRSVVFSHDSTKLASSSNDKTIRIWDAETSGYEQALEGHSHWVTSVVFSHDLTKLASSSNDKTIRIWNAETIKCERVLEGHSGWVTAVVFSHDSTKLASSSNDKTIRIWNAETIKCERVLEGHSGWVTAVVFSHDSTKLASSSYDKTIRIWNAETGECEDVISLDDYAGVLSFTPDERGIITDRGVVILTGGSRSSVEPPTLLQPLEAPMLICKDGTWVSIAGAELLWLPPECRNGKVATAGNTVVIGCRSGRVVLLGISVADMQSGHTTQKIEENNSDLLT
ncbi:LOW QUALITY PROTEIN: NACHT domain-containing protein [Fusarium acuminatum]|uniref:NACHT domain-containing protein n=1 Tax=Fusarium acuminatum TaxID=5515 RepID=A0ABZ2WKG6_9HYPO